MNNSASTENSFRLKLNWWEEKEKDSRRNSRTRKLPGVVHGVQTTAIYATFLAAYML